MEEFQSPIQGISTELLWGNFWCTNSKGQLLGIRRYGKDVEILNKSGQWTMFCQLRQATKNCGNDQEVMALAIDRHDNVFVIINFDELTGEKCVYVLFVFDSSGNEEYERVLDLPLAFVPALNCVVDNDDDIIIKVRFDDHLYVCDNNGNIKSRLSLEQGAAYYSEGVTILECVTDKNKIVIRCGTRSSPDKVLVYTKEGTLKRTIKVKGEVLGVKYNDSTSSKIEILVDNESGKRPYTILSYNDNDEVERLCLPVNRLAFSYSHYAVLISPNNSRENYQVLFG